MCQIATRNVQKHVGLTRPSLDIMVLPSQSRFLDDTCRASRVRDTSCVLSRATRWRRSLVMLCSCLYGLTQQHAIPCIMLGALDAAMTASLLNRDDSLALAGSFEESRNSKLLTREQEHELGTRIQNLMRVTAVGRRLAISLGRQPTIEEWAKACRMSPEELKVMSGEAQSVVTLRWCHLVVELLNARFTEASTEP